MPKSHHSFRILIAKSLKSLNPFNKTYISPISIRKFITKTYDFQFLKISNYYFKKAIQKMLETSILQKHEKKFKFRMKPKHQKNKVNKKPQKKKVPIIHKNIIKNKNKKPIITSMKPKQKKCEKSKINSLKPNKATSKQKAVKIQTEFVKGQPIWQFYNKNNHEARVQSSDGWYNYELKATEIVEEEWQKYINNRMMCDVRAVKSGYFEYSVDFMSWHQTNITHQNHTVRKIRRLDENGNVTINPYQ